MEWCVGLATRLLLTACYVTATVHFSIRSIVSNKNGRYCVPIYIFNANTCMQLKLRDVLTKRYELTTNEMTMCIICTSNVSGGSGEIESDLYYIHPFTSGANYGTFTPVHSSNDITSCQQQCVAQPTYYPSLSILNL